MSFLADWQIRQRLALPPDHYQHLGIDPYSPPVSRPGVISSGLSSYGYDVRCGRNFLVLTSLPGGEIDPKTLKGRIERGDFEGSWIRDVDSALIPPHSFALAESLETFRIPRDVLALVLGKSTYARCGTILNMTPLEPEWRGRVTLEISNSTPLPVRVHAGEGLGQVVFSVQEYICESSYADKRGRYQDQAGLTPPSAD